ncbi:MAG: acetyl-CoA carboxylase biotin carboxyl carrier protein subunit [Bacteroidota bacterium]|nr:acetyl-CoA carboxylase biotin carboxyl carrier protein subunit [Bacteroidota bacterium]
MKCIIEHNDITIDLGNDTETSWELVKPGVYRWIHPQTKKLTLAHVLHIDQSKKTITFSSDGKDLGLRYQDQWDVLLEKMGFDSEESTQNQPLIAPMPGLVLSVEVKPGDVVQKGQALVKLEAMKMENLLKAQTDNQIVAKVHVSQGENVEKNKVLIEFQSN